MEEIAQVYARALFEVASERDLLDVIREQLGEFVEALESNTELQIFFFSPYFSTGEKKDALGRMIKGADEVFMRFLETLVDAHRMPVLFRLRARYEQLWDEANRVRIGEQTGQKVELTTADDPEILGGVVVRVGNAILDASIKGRLEQLRKQLARA